MSSEIHSRWPVLLTLPLRSADLDADRRLTRVAVERFFGAARGAYFDLCTTIDPSTLELTATATVIGAPVEGSAVTISAGVVEVYPNELALEARLRGGDRTAARSRCVLSAPAGVSTTQRDELVALAHGARHLH